MKDDLISRQAAIDALDNIKIPRNASWYPYYQQALIVMSRLPSAQPEIIRCKDCKFYSPMNRETKTGICNLTMRQNFGDNWFCAGAERRTDD